LDQGSRYFILSELNDTRVPLDTYHLIWSCNEPIPTGLLDGCSQLKSITFNQCYNKPIYPNSVPESVASIRFGYGFNIDMDLMSFPINLQYLYLANDYKTTIKPNSLPNKLRVLEIGNNNWNDYSFLPASCERVIFNMDYQSRQMIDLTTLPPSVKYIKLDGKLGVGIKYPPSVKCFTLNNISIFKKSEFKQIAISTTTTSTDIQLQQKRINGSVKLHVRMDSMIKPNSLIENCIKSIYWNEGHGEQRSYYYHNNNNNNNSNNNAIIPNMFPESVETIIFGARFNRTLYEGTFPITNLKKLVFGDDFNKPIDTLKSLTSLEELEFGVGFYKVFTKDTLPQSLKKLVFKYGLYHHDLLSVIPSSVTDLTLGIESNSFPKPFVLPIETVPLSITRLRLGDNQCINSVLMIPSHIKHIRLGPTSTDLHTPIPSTTTTIESFELGDAHGDKPLHFILPSPHTI